ncbi:MAG: uroporphyrinogen-III synthase [Bacteroidetes bacterium]|nr:uroporphyrinogen-III synthase [Bacteroidota bacterium]
MPENKIEILCTRPVNDELIQEAFRNDIIVDVIPFIETEPIETVEVQQEIEQAYIQSATIVFTSMNAVEAVGAYLEDQEPEWRIYCIGNTTKQLVAEYFGEEKIYGTAASAAELAELIVEEAADDEVIFFCGDQRRNELPDILRSNDIDVTEIVVYHTIPVPRKISKEYIGILFFSPSAADSFFRLNKVGEKTILFTIGNTTANAVSKYSSNKIIISKVPDKEHLLEEAINYFS